MAVPCSSHHTSLAVCCVAAFFLKKKKKTTPGSFKRCSPSAAARSVGELRAWRTVRRLLQDGHLLLGRRFLTYADDDCMTRFLLDYGECNRAQADIDSICSNDDDMYDRLKALLQKAYG